MGVGREEWPLRDDIRYLGTLLGDTIRRIDGELVFARVEQFRKLCKALHHSHDATLKEELSQLIENIDFETGTKVIKAFLTYFDLINIAEQHHRLRRRSEIESRETARHRVIHLRLYTVKADKSETNGNRSGEQYLKEALENLDIQVVFSQPTLPKSRDAPCF